MILRFTFRPARNFLDHWVKAEDEAKAISPDTVEAPLFTLCWNKFKNISAPRASKIRWSKAMANMLRPRSLKRWNAT